MWNKELSIAGHAAEAAGKTLTRMFGKVTNIRRKSDIDLVTEADIQAEKIILDTIHRYFPQDNLLSEEAGRHDEGSDRTWVIDPLDGTTNFAHGFPFFAISIALQIREEIVLGVVYNPYLDEYFEAAQNMGATLNKKPIRVSKTPSLGEALLATGFPYTIHEEPQAVMHLLEKLVTRVQGVRRSGSAAIDLCYVAAARLDGFWEQELKPWDTAAGSIIVKEAGGNVSTFQGEPFSPYLTSITASNPLIHNAIIRVLNG